MKKSRVEIIPANATKLDGRGAIFITIDPQFVDCCQNIFEEVQRIVKHENIAIFPLPADAIKFYSIKTNPEMITVEANLRAIGITDAK